MSFLLRGIPALFNIGKKIFSGAKSVGKWLFGGGLNKISNVGKKIHQGIDVAKSLPIVGEKLSNNQFVNTLHKASDTVANLNNPQSQLGRVLNTGQQLFNNYA